MAPRKTHRRFSPPALSAGEVLPIDPTNPLRNQEAAVEAYIARGLAAGMTPVELLAGVLPSIADEREAKAARIKESNARATAKRMARIAAQNDPEKRERERQRFQAKLRATAQSNAARDRRLAAEDAAKAAALVENPTLAWRKPRRKGWVPPDDYAVGGRRRNKKKIQENAI